MKKERKLLTVMVSLLLCLSMNMTVFAKEMQYGGENNNYCTETETESGIMPRYTANLDFSEIPVSHATHGSNKFNMNPGGTITCNFNSTGKFSLALYNYDTETYWISDTVHDSSCSSVLTIHVAGNYGIGVYNRDTKAIKVTGSYSL